MSTFDAHGVEFREPAFVLSRRHLIASKRAAGRLQDLADLEALEKLRSPDGER